MKIPVSISAEALERKFDEGNEDILQYFDMTTLEQPNKELQPLQLELPQDLLQRLDFEAGKVGVAPQALVKVWIAERLGVISAPPAV